MSYYLHNIHCHLLQIQHARKPKYSIIKVHHETDMGIWKILKNQDTTTQPRYFKKCV